MIGFSTRSLETIRSFAGELGTQAALAADGSFSFIFSRSGTLTLTPSEDGDRILVSLAQRREGPEADNHWRALASARFDRRIAQFIHAGLAADGSLLRAVSLEEAELDLPTLDAVIQRLVEIGDE